MFDHTEINLLQATTSYVLYTGKKVPVEDTMTWLNRQILTANLQC